MFEAFMPQAQDPNVAGPSLEELRKRKLMAELLQGRRGPPKIEHPLQGVAHILDSALTGYREGQENKRLRAQETDAASIRNDMARALMGGGSPAPTSAPAVAPAPAPATGAAATQASGVNPASLIQSESGGDWGARNSVPRRDGTVGHFGRLQFSQPRIAEAAAAGAIPQGTTPQAFMASPELQQAAERWHFADIDRNIRERGLDRYVGQQINGVPVTLEGMRAVAHLGGNQGLARFLETGGRYNPQDANGTSLLNYLQRHGSQRRAEAPADTLTGSDGMEAPPLVDGRNLPPDTQAPALDRPAMSFDEAMPPADPAPPAPIAAGPDPRALAQALMSAPVPEPRPPTPTPSVDNMMAGDQVAPQGAPMQAPMPQPRPNLEPPPQAMPAGPAPQPPPQAIAQALAHQMNERDRLMLLRDEQSLAPGEADRLRQGLPNPQAIAAVMQGRPLPQATPAPGPAQMPTQQPPQPQGMPMPQGGPQQMQAPMPPSAAPQAAPQMQGPPGQIPDQLLLRMMNNPQTRAFAMQEIQRRQQQNTPQAQAALAKAQADARIAQQQAEGNNPTDFERDFRNYEREERAAGRTPLSRFEFGQQRRRAAANSVNVNTTETGDNAFNTETAKKQAAMFDTLATDGLTARADAARIAELRRLGDRIGTGAGASLQAFAAQYGIKLGNNVSEIEAFQAIVNQLVPQQRPAGSGAMSDRDVQLFRDSLPSLVKTPGGNAIIFDTMQGIAEYRQQQAQIAARAQMGEIPRAQAIRELQALPDPLAAFRESRRTPSAAPPPPAAGGTQPPSPAVELLRSNPSPTARQQFDQVFGAGAADRILGGR